jgi:hypothetical protein
LLLPLLLLFLFVIPKGDLLSPTSHKRTGAPSFAWFYRAKGGNEYFKPTSLSSLQLSRYPCKSTAAHSFLIRVYPRKSVVELHPRANTHHPKP